MRYVFFISDGTGITAETLGNSLISQFEDVQFQNTSIPYVKDVAKAEQAAAQISQTAKQHNTRPIVFTTLVNPELRDIISKTPCKCMDLFKTFLVPLEEELGEKSSYTIGRYHSIANIGAYKTRIDAVNFALANDDGIGIKNYHKADIILIGVSRSGKTPTCLYLALQFGTKAANYPFTEEDMQHLALPTFLKEYRKKLFGLLIEPQHLHSIRKERRPNSQYASLNQCRIEINELKTLFAREKIPYVDTTTRSIEEISTKILAVTGIERRLV